MEKKNTKTPNAVNDESAMTDLQRMFLIGCANDFFKMLHYDVKAKFHEYVEYVRVLTDDFNTPNKIAFNYNDAYKNTNELCAAWLKYVGEQLPLYDTEIVMDYFNEKKRDFEIAIKIYSLNELVEDCAKQEKVMVEFGEDSDGYTTVYVVGNIK